MKLTTDIKTIITVGPATKNRKDLLRLKAKGVDFIRVNMSHSSLEDFIYFVNLAKEVGLPFIIDTEGSQIRTGFINNGKAEFKEGSFIKLYKDNGAVGNNEILFIKPKEVISQLQEGDLVYVDFDSLVLRVTDVSSLSSGYITTQVITGGFLGSNKAVVIDPVIYKEFNLPVLSTKDKQAIALGLREGLKHIAVSFVRRPEDVIKVREETKNSMKIISKIECLDALRNLDEIIKVSDYILVDRGDLSKEISLEKIPYAQKLIIERANYFNKDVFIATNLLETMVKERKPTRAEVNDVVNSIIDGAAGLTLAAETAIGKYPFECVDMLKKLIRHAGKVSDLKSSKKDFSYLFNPLEFSSLVEPHGGKLVNRVLTKVPNEDYLSSLKKIKLDGRKMMDIEQIAIGAYSPLEGFMNKNDFTEVLDNMRLSNGIVWPLPILLDVSEDTAKKISKEKEVLLVNDFDEVVAILHIDDIYAFNKKELAEKVYGKADKNHPGVFSVNKMNPILIGGKIDLIKRQNSFLKTYELTPSQTRRLFEDRHWSTVAGFHTRNVVHRGHEFMQNFVLENEHCDGLFIHPVIGHKKTGDFKEDYIIKSYQLMFDKFYPSHKVVLGVFSTYSRYAGPREAMFTAICRKNFGCSHFIIGRDHTGVGNFYGPYDSQKIFEQFPDIGVKIIPFGEIFYSEKKKDYIHSFSDDLVKDKNLSIISGSEARRMLKSGTMPPSWLMREEISKMILDAIKKGDKVFVE